MTIIPLIKNYASRVRFVWMCVQIRLLALSLCLLILVNPLILYSEEDQSPYFTLQKIYYNWTENFYGADSFYYREMLYALYRLKDTRFATPVIFTHMQRGVGNRGEMYSAFRFSSWLSIYVDKSEKALIDFLGEIEQSERLQGVSIGLDGILYKYKVVNRENEKSVIIYLKDIKIKLLKDDKVKRE